MISFGATGKLNDSALLAALDKNNKEKFLFPVSDINKDDDKVLEQHGLNVTKAVMFRTVSNNFQPGEDLDYDMLLFFSPAGIESLKKNFPDFNQGDIRIGCFGASTAKAVEDAGLRLDVKAPTPAAPSITAAIENYLKEEAAKEA